MIFGWGCGCASLVFASLMETTHFFPFGIGQDANPIFTDDEQVALLLCMFVNEKKMNRNQKEASVVQAAGSW